MTEDRILEDAFDYVWNKTKVEMQKGTKVRWI